jgi:hypothetical protein
MIIDDRKKELNCTRIKFFLGEIEKMNNLLDQISWEMEELEDDSIPFSADRLNKLTMRMSAVCNEISVYRNIISDIKKIESN